MLNNKQKGVITKINEGFEWVLNDATWWTLDQEEIFYKKSCSGSGEINATTEPSLRLTCFPNYKNPEPNQAKNQEELSEMEDETTKSC